MNKIPEIQIFGNFLAFLFFGRKFECLYDLPKLFFFSVKLAKYFQLVAKLILKKKPLCKRSRKSKPFLTFPKPTSPNKIVRNVRMLTAAMTPPNVFITCLTMKLTR